MPRCVTRFKTFSGAVADTFPLDVVTVAWALLAISWVTAAPVRGFSVRGYLSIGFGITWTILRAVGYFGGSAGTPLHLFFVAGVAQPILSLSWAELGVGLLLRSVQTRLRNQWVSGAGLCIATTAKLVLFDMAGTNSLLRVGSFIGVGVLFVLAGYFAPMPPGGNPPDSE